MHGRAAKRRSMKIMEALDMADCKKKYFNVRQAPYHPSYNVGVLRIRKNLMQLGRKVLVAFLMLKGPPAVFEVR